MPLIPQSDLLVVTSYPPHWDELARYTAESQAAYCKARGYDFYADRSDLRDKWYNRCLKETWEMGIQGFIKFDLLLHFMPQYKYVVWLDADLIVTNRDFDLVEQVFRRHYQDVTVCFDWNSFNSTVICVRSSDAAWSYLWACNNTGRNLFLNDGWHEMSSLKYFSQFPPYHQLLGYESCKKLCAILPDEYEPHGVPRRVMTPYAWDETCFSVHLSALNLERRIELARSFYEKYCA